MAYRPEVAGPLNDLAEVLLRGSSPLSRGERELIAAFVSGRNGCDFCCQSHGAVARHELAASCGVVSAVLENVDGAPISNKLRALLVVADRVRQGGRLLTEVEVARARAAGANDLEIHDTVLISAAFCMFNRYVDGLATTASPDAAVYDSIGKALSERGYRATFAAVLRRS